MGRTIQLAVPPIRRRDSCGSRTAKAGSLFTDSGHREVRNKSNPRRKASRESAFFPGDFIREHTLPGIEPTAYKCAFVKGDQAFSEGLLVS